MVHIHLALAAVITSTGGVGALLFQSEFQKMLPSFVAAKYAFLLEPERIHGHVF